MLRGACNFVLVLTPMLACPAPRLPRHSPTAAHPRSTLVVARLGLIGRCRTIHNGTKSSWSHAMSLVGHVPYLPLNRRRRRVVNDSDLVTALRRWCPSIPDRVSFPFQYIAGPSTASPHLVPVRLSLPMYDEITHGLGSGRCMPSLRYSR
jgi:hypothetical protein